MMKKFLFTLLSLNLAMFVLSGCQPANRTKDNISEITGVNVNTAKKISGYDNHGGGGGDGTSCIILSFSDDTTLNEIKNNSNWKVLPFDEVVTALVYGVSDESRSIGPYLGKDSEGKPLIPPIQNGYYLFIDRQTDKPEMKTISDILERYSFNYTLAVYDTDTDLLYYVEEDT